MYNSYITTSSITTFRTRNVYPYSYNHDYYSNCSSDRYSFAVSSQRTSCCCFSSCSSSVYRVPASASYCYDLYNGCSRQSSLIQCRRLCYGGYYLRLPVCEVDRRHCCCDKSVKEKRVSKKKRGLKKCMVIERRSESYDDAGDNNEVESILSLLTDDVGEECFRVRRESKRLVKEPLVERRENGGVNNRYESKKKRNDLGYLESEARLEYELGESSSRKRDDRRGGSFEKENRKASKVGDSREVLRVNQREEDIEQEKSLLRSRKESSDAREQVRIRTKEEEKKESLLRSRKEDLNARERVRIRANEEEKEESLRREEHRNRMRKDGSSCSSYYSVDSTGDYESDEEIELKAGGTAENSSVRHENVVRNETGYQKRDDYREDFGVNLTKKESNARSSVIESDFRKKSEKKLLDSSVEEVVSRKETVQKEAEISMARGSGYGKSSLKNEDRKVTSTGISSLDFQRQQIYAQEISRQSESRTESKQFKGNQDINSGSAETSYGSQKIKSSKDEISSKAAKSSQTAVRLSKGEDEIQRKSHNSTVMSDTIDVDIKKMSISLQEFETNVKRRNDYSSNTDSSAYDSEKKHNEVSELVEPKRKSEQLRKGESNSSLMIQSDNQLKKQGDNVKLLYGSSMLSEKQQSQSHAYFTRRDDNKYQSDEVNNISIGQSGDSSGIVIKDDYKSESSITSAPSSSHFASHEDAIGSAARFQESSKHYIGELADDVRHEMLSSETQIEKETRETQLKVGTSSIQNTSVDSESKEHESSRISQGSGSKGPSAEMWTVDGTSTGNQSNPESLEDPNKNNDVIVKRNGRSMWNIIGDVLRLRWSPRSESQSTSGKTSGRSSPNQSTGSETFFSGHEAEEIEEVAGKKENKIKIEELASDTQEEDKTKKSPSSSTLVGHLKPVGISAPSSSVAIDSGLSSTGFQLPFTGEFSRSNFVGTSVASASKLRRSPVVRSVSEGEEASISETGINEQLTSGVEQSGLARDDGEQKERRMLQRKDQIVKDQFDEWEDAYRFDAEQRKVDEMFMREALLEAKKAGDNWEVPVGAVLVHNGKIIARGYNLVEELRDSTAHAEMICIREGSNLLRTWRLSETTLYVTLEPCPMCAGAILQARVDTVVWGAPNKLLGADGSWIRLFPNGGSGSELEQQSDKPAAPVHPFHPKIIIRRGVLSSECAETMQQFFQLRRRRKDKKPQESTSSPSTSSRLSISQHPSKILKKMHQAFHIMFCL